MAPTEEVTRDFCFDRYAKLQKEYRTMLIGIDETGDRLIRDVLTGVPYSENGRKRIGKPPTLLMAAPGFGKTDSAVTIASAIDGRFSFIPFHPEMKVSDLLGADIYDPASGSFYFAEGPVCTSHIVLADEISRGHPKTQACLLQVMEERVAIGSRMDSVLKRIVSKITRLVRITDEPDEVRQIQWIIATGNPFEQEGTYPIPEAQLDRFTTCYGIDAPGREDEKKIRLTSVYDPNDERNSPKVQKVTTLKEIYDMTNFIIRYVRPINQLPDDSANELLQRYMENSRPKGKSDGERRVSAPSELRDFVDNYVKAGLSPRANFHFEAASRTLAFFRERNYISVDDIKDVARLVMAHRIMLKPLAKGRGVKQQDVVEEILRLTPLP
ncbi:MAG: AAA family ATPase [Candidatus Yanofskybacteria bacterium]|nr:AAA family ATPase [Candidatus Yanofskybacteria bacterium]